MSKQSFSTRFSVVMDAAGLTTTALHELTGIEETSISKFRSGVRKPNIDNLGKLVKHLPETTDLYWLITGENHQ